jgi:hypothetical protein
MTRTHALALAVTLAAASPAFADDITVEPFPFVSTLSRAQVQQELRQHRHAGINPWADDYNQLAQFRGSMTRAEVTAEFMAARQSVAAFNAEDSGSVHLAKVHAPAASRAIVVAGVR